MTCTACGGMVELDAAYCGICGSKLRARRATLVGAVLAGKYQIAAKIAEGGFGSIYQATHLESGLDCALKVLHAELAQDDSLAARFRREGATLARLHDPHTVATYDVGEAEDGTLFIAMELLRGDSLHDRMSALGTITWRIALAIVRDVCSALAEAHDLGIVHRDLKPANIHLVDDDQVKLLDFGIAKVTGSEVDDGAELTRTGQTVGTLEYMAPEQIIGGSCEPRSDIYQLGVLLFEMITGRRPFADSKEPTAMITALLTQSPPRPSSVFAGALPAEIDALILRCLEREPEHRFANVRELIAAIVKALGSTVVDDADEPTWIGTLVPMPPHAPMYAGSGSLATVPSAPSLIPIGPPEVSPAPISAFDVPVRGSVTEGRPLESTGSVTAISAYSVEPLPSKQRPDPFERTAPAPVIDDLRTPAQSASPDTAIPAPHAHPAVVHVSTPLPFAARLALWTTGLALAGAAIGAAIGVLAG